MKRQRHIPSRDANQRFKASETLLGIETGILNRNLRFNYGFKASETFLGIETIRSIDYVS